MPPSIARRADHVSAKDVRLLCLLPVILLLHTLLLTLCVKFACLPRARNTPAALGH